DGVREWDGKQTLSPIKIVAGIPFALLIYCENWAGEEVFVVTLWYEQMEDSDWTADISYTFTLYNDDPTKNRVKEDDHTLDSNDVCACFMEMDIDDVMETRQVPKGFINENRLSMTVSFTVHNVCGVRQPNIHLN
ncbi:hypothetical protein PFISCL1PPCAC_21188, partial [Pristionchus fissidentatus]